jgi:hypothetical protein
MNMVLGHQSDKTYVRLRPHVVVVQTAARLVLIGDFAWVYPDPPDELGAVVDLMRAPAGVALDAVAALVGRDDADELCNALCEHGFLQIGNGPFASGSESPCRDYFESALDSVQAGLAACSFVLVGCGGIGCEVARHLTASGAGKITLIDFDKIALSNLNRQYLFTLDDIGKPKVDVARAALLEAAQGTEILAVTARIQTVHDLETLGLEPATAVLCCADTPRDIIGNVVHRYARSQRSWFGICGVGVLSGFWGPILSPDSATVYQDILTLQGEQELLPAATEVRASFGPTNSLIAAAFTRDVVHALLGDRPSSLGHRVDLDFRSFQSKRTPWEHETAADPG